MYSGNFNPAHLEKHHPRGVPVKKSVVVDFNRPPGFYKEVKPYDTTDPHTVQVDPPIQGNDIFGPDMSRVVPATENNVEALLKTLINVVASQKISRPDDR